VIVTLPAGRVAHQESIVAEGAGRSGVDRHRMIGKAAEPVVGGDPIGHHARLVSWQRRRRQRGRGKHEPEAHGPTG
jgi:hypothetical protein